MSPRTAYLKQTSEQRCREAFKEMWSLSEEDIEDLGMNDPDWFGADLWTGWAACWKYLEERLLKEIQS